jgi:hypothetical protein
VAKIILPLVAVRWHDAKGDATKEIDAENVHQWHKPHVITTFGLLMVDDDIGITILTEDTENGDYRGPTFILRSLVQETWLVSANPYRRKKLKTVNANDEAPEGT